MVLLKTTNMGDNYEAVADVESTKLNEGINEAKAKINNRMMVSELEAADNGARLSFWSKIKEATDPFYKKNINLAWRDTKLALTAFFSVLPLLGEAEGAMLIDAALLEGATRAEAEALARGAVVGANGVVSETLTMILGEKTLDGVRKGLKLIDPFEGVPTEIVLAAAGAEIAGVPGALAILACAKLSLNMVERMVESGKMTADVGKVVIDEIKDRIKKAKSPEMVASAAAFA